MYRIIFRQLFAKLLVNILAHVSSSILLGPGELDELVWNCLHLGQRLCIDAQLTKSASIFLTGSFLSTPVHQLLDILSLVKVLADELSSESLVEDEAVVVLIEAVHIDAHEAEEFGVDELLASEDAHLLGEDLAEIHIHLLGLLIERKEHLRRQIEQVTLVLVFLALREDVIFQRGLREAGNEEVLDQRVRMTLNT